jgi:hypothetical protein
LPNELYVGFGQWDEVVENGLVDGSRAQASAGNKHDG